MNAKDLAIVALVYSMLTAAWLYAYSTTTFTLVDTISFDAMFTIMPQLPALFATGIIIAASVVFLSFYSLHTDRAGLAMGGAVGSLAAALCGAFFFKNLDHYAMMMAFHLLGTVWTCYSAKGEFGGSFSKLRYGWGAPKKMIYCLTIGAALSSLFFMGYDPEFYQAQFKESIVDATGGMNMGDMMKNVNIGDMLTRDDVAEMVDSQTMAFDAYRAQSLAMQGIETKADVEAMVRQQYETQANWDTIPANQQAKLIKDGTDASWESMEKQIQDAYKRYISPEEKAKRTELAWAAMQERSMEQEAAKLPDEAMKRVASQMIDQVPMMKVLMEFLPVMAAMIALSAVSLFGTLCVSPFAALMALALQEKKRL